VALNRYVIVSTVTVPAGTAATLTPGEPGTGAPAGPGNASVASDPLLPVTFLKKTPLILDTASALYTALNGAGALRLYVPGTDDRGGAALSN
jgi:hypothetical protein